MKRSCMFCKHTNGVNCSCTPSAVILIWDYIEKNLKGKRSVQFYMLVEKYHLQYRENKRFIGDDKTTVMNSWNCGLLYSKPDISLQTLPVAKPLLS